MFVIERDDTSGNTLHAKPLSNVDRTLTSLINRFQSQRANPICSLCDHQNQRPSGGLQSAGQRAHATSIDRMFAGSNPARGLKAA
jgi:hypothetical protein